MAIVDLKTNLISQVVGLYGYICKKHMAQLIEALRAKLTNKQQLIGLSEGPMTQARKDGRAGSRFDSRAFTAKPRAGQ